MLGFSYKENVGDPRESPVEVFVEELRKKGARVWIVDLYGEWLPEWVWKSGEGCLYGT